MPLMPNFLGGFFSLFEPGTRTNAKYLVINCIQNYPGRDSPGVFENLHNEPRIQECVFSHHDGSKMDGPEFRYGLITRIPLLGRCHAAERSARGIIAIRFSSGQYVRLA